MNNHIHVHFWICYACEYCEGTKQDRKYLCHLKKICYARTIKSFLILKLQWEIKKKKALFLWPAFNIPQTGLIVSSRLHSPGYWHPSQGTTLSVQWPKNRNTWLFVFWAHSECLVNEQCYFRKRIRCLCFAALNFDFA